MRSISIFFYWLIFIVLNHSLFAQNEVNYKEMIAQYEKTLQSIHSLSYSYNSDYEHDALCFFCDKKVYLSNSFSEKNDAGDVYKGSNEFLLKNNNLITVQKKGDDFIIVSQDISPEDQKSLGFFVHYLLLGFVHDKIINLSYIPDVLREYVTYGIEKQIDGKNIIELHGKKNDVEVLAWIVPSQNYSLQKFRYQVDESSAQDGDTVFFEYQPEHFQQVGEYWFPTQYNYEFEVLSINYDYDKNMNLAPRKSTRNKGQYSSVLSKIKVNQKISEKTFRIKTEIPNGTLVSNLDAPQIEYIWMDGNIVPKTDERMLAIVRQGHKFVPGPKESRFWLMAIGILVILIAGGIHLRRYLKSED